MPIELVYLKFNFFSGKHDYNKEKRKLKAEKKAAELRKTESPVKVKYVAYKRFCIKYK